MPKTPKATDGEAPKKSPRKTAPAAETGTKVVKTAKAASKSAKPKAAKTETSATDRPMEVVAAAVKEVLQMTSLEERIRARAYELYLRRGGQGGSPEQDWFQAAAEVYGESVA